VKCGIIERSGNQKKTGKEKATDENAKDNQQPRSGKNQEMFKSQGQIII